MLLRILVSPEFVKVDTFGGSLGFYLSRSFQRVLHDVCFSSGGQIFRRLESSNKNGSKMMRHGVNVLSPLKKKL